MKRFVIFMGLLITPFWAPAAESSYSVIFGKSEEIQYSVTCFSTAGTPYVLITPSQIKTIERNRAEAVNYKVVLKNGNTLYVPSSSCFIEEAKEHFLLNQYLIEGEKK